MKTKELISSMKTGTDIFDERNIFYGLANARTSVADNSRLYK